VADGLCEIAIGSDTGGSTRIPAALCGIVGWKPSRQRISTEGAFPLSFTLDSIGPMAKRVAECANADAVMAGEKPQPVQPVSLTGLKLGIAQGFPLEGLDETVAKAWQNALDKLGKAGVRLSEETIALFPEMVAVNAKGGFAPPEAYTIHRDRLARRGGDVDQNIRARIERGGGMTAADYIEMGQQRLRLIRAMDARLAGLDALILPTTPIVAPKIAEVATPETFAPRNMLLLRNTSMVNFFDLCAISLPLPRWNNLAAGLMVVARNGQDGHLFRIAAAVERLFA
jgi:aspartyl-tRNA(Asn)/glutamyl-tRNA(Gln) amidotransferase subunit A